MRIVVLLALMVAALPAAAQTTLSSADRAAAFRAAGFKLQGKAWSACGDPGTASYTPGEIESVRDLNGDGRPEAIVTEGSVFCFGATSTGFVLVSKQADGSWKRIAQSEGIATALPTKGAGGWPDIEIGGPGFCHRVERWNGKAYAPNRREYEGKPCK